MFRLALSRAAQAYTSAPAAQPVRSIASSSARWAARTPPRTGAAAPRRTGAGASPDQAQASPAERPPDVPDSVTPPRTAPASMDDKPFEPIVNDMTSLGGPHEVSGGSPVASESADAPEPRFDPSTLPSLDVDPTAALPAPAAEEPSSSGRTRARAKPSLSSIEQRRRNLARLGMGAVLIGAGAGAWYLAQQSPDAVAVELGKESEAKGPYERFRANLSDLLDYFNKPAFSKLLPDPLPPPHQRPYTLLIDLEGFLTHSSWDRANGWKTAKRPGVDYFLAYLSQFYEIVLFTTQPSYTAMGVADKLDPFQAYLPYKLYRESTRYVKGKIVKDLSYLNRDLSKVILVDTNAEHVALNPENAIVVPAWNGQPGDKGLVDLIPFLESVGIFAPPDVRPILKAYEGKNIPVEYAKREAERKQAAIEEWEREHGTAVAGASGAGWLSKVFGALGGSTVPRPTQPMTYLESKRAQAQKMYLEEQEYWAKNADEIRRLMEEDRQKQLAEQKGSLLGFMAGPKPPTDAQAAR